MPEFTTDLLHLDLPGPARVLPVGPTRVQGWLVARPGGHYSDVRIVWDRKVFPGIHGFPRRDVAEYLNAARPCLLAGFEIPVNLPIGTHRLFLEGCSIAGSWERLETLDVEARPGATDPITAVVPLRAREFGEALRVLLRRLGSDNDSPAVGAAAVINETPRPHYLRHPHLPFCGHLDEPQAWTRSVFGRIAISGWLFHETQAIKRIFATTDLQAVQNLRYGRETPFLAAFHPAFPRALRCGFDGYLDLPAQLPQPVTVRVYAELDDGSWHLGSVARIASTDHEFAKRPFARFSPLTFFRAWRALGREAAVQKVNVDSGRDYRQEILAAWKDYRAQAPRREITRKHPTNALSLSSGPAPLGHVHYCTHNLSHQGAPLFLLEHARHLQRETGARLTVTSGQEGPLRADFESLGAVVQVIDEAPLLAAMTESGRQRAWDRFAKSADLPTARLVIANTISSYWGVHLAHRAGQPVLYYVHESTPPRSLYRGALSRPALTMVEASLQLANRVSFLTATSQRYFGPFSDQSNYCINPGWIDLAGIDNFRSAQSRDSSRQLLGMPSGKKLVINVGTVCDRKGQHLFARAVDLLWQYDPKLATEAEFLMVGGGDTAYDLELVAFLSELDHPNLRIVPATGNVYQYYHAADLFVCSSYEESFPRVILEAMAFGVPIVSTNVHGIPEMVGAEVEAVLVPPGDSAALATAMQRLLASPNIGRLLAQRARTRVVENFDSRIVLPRHLSLARSVAMR